jgi:hypothetical protein
MIRTQNVTIWSIFENQHKLILSFGFQVGICVVALSKSQ